MRKIILSLILLTLATASVDAHKKKAKRKKVVRKSVVTKTDTSVVDTKYANTMLLCSSKNGMPVWYMAIVKDFQFPTNFMAPANYRLLSISDKQLDEYLHSIPYDNSDKHITIPLYMNGIMECKDFTITRTETMDSVLQAKYPQLMSFKAFEKGNNLNAARIDCDGSSTKFMVTYNGTTYFVNPVKFKNKIYYASYTKDDPNFVKQKFER
jgi:hypothetical protein